ncbi:MAG: O-antigen ligase family protein [Bacteroidetes bacterium]|nr:O-antigen ligase family protein [Bacteroidota bacterium]
MLFPALHGITLIYSSNFPYGLSKFYGIIFNLILNILALRFILVNFSKELFKKIIEVILFAGLLLTVVSAIRGPFVSFYDEYAQMKIFGIGMWSHVGFGRYMGFAFLISIINLTRLNFLKGFHLDKMLLLTSFAGLILSGLRSAIFTSLFASLLFLIYTAKDKKVSFGKIFLFIVSGSAVLAAAAYINNSFGILIERLSQIGNIFNQRNLSDGAISTRIHIYKHSFDLFIQNIFTGRGLGGYYDEKLFEYTRGLKYPHNIFIEYGIELGAAGLAFILAIIFLIFKSVAKVNTALVFVFIYFVLLSMFSYSIPFQTGMFCFIAFIGLGKTVTEKLKADYRSPA